MKYAYLACIVLCFLIFAHKVYVFLDPDFGWHIKLSQIIANSGLPTTDPFSYTMPSFPLVDHEWLYHWLLGTLYPTLGKFGLSILFATMGLLAVFICIPKKANTVLSSILFIIGCTGFYSTFAVSPRVVSWLLFAVILYLTLNKSIWLKLWWTIPLVMLMWVNAHGSFILGIIVLGVIFFARSVMERKIQSKELFTLLCSLVAVFINPYRYKLFELVILNIFDAGQKSQIAEWVPSVFMPINIPLSMFFLFALSTILFIKYFNKFHLEEITLNIVFLILALTALRNIPFWVLISLTTISKGLNYFYLDMQKLKESMRRFNIFFKLSLIISLMLFIYQVAFALYKIKYSFNENDFYPSSAIYYLSNSIPKGQIFSDYNWGGYLIWKLPQKKVFVSGLMPVWKSDKLPPDQSKNAMKDYMNIITGKVDYKPIFENFDIDTVLFPNKSSTFIKNLEEDGWRMVYKDQVAIIYRK